MRRKKPQNKHTFHAFNRIERRLGRHFKGAELGYISTYGARVPRKITTMMNFVIRGVQQIDLQYCYVFSF